MLRGEFAEGLEVAGPRGDEAHVAGDGLEQDGGDLAGMMVEEIGHGRGVIERAEQGILRGARGDALLLGA